MSADTTRLTRCAFLVGLLTIAACVDFGSNSTAKAEEPVATAPEPAAPEEPVEEPEDEPGVPEPTGDDLPTVPVPPTAGDPVPPDAGDGTMNYDIVYVRYPREGDDTDLDMPDGEHPYRSESGADLMLLHPDGTEEILVDCDDTSSVLDPIISYDARWVYYAKYVNRDVRKEYSKQTGDCFLFKMRLDVSASWRVEIQLTDASTDFHTDKMAGNTDADLESMRKMFGIRDLGPALLPDGRILFTTNRETLLPPLQGNISSVNIVEGVTVLQMCVIDDHDGSTPNRSLKIVGHSNLHMAQHPIVLRDGRILFTNWDDAALRVDRNMATLYTVHPDGSYLAQFLEPHNLHRRTDHFSAQLWNGDIVTVMYYPGTSWGFGVLNRFPLDPEGPDFNPGTNTDEDIYRYFSRKDGTNLTPHTNAGHSSATDLSGKYAMPAAGPGDVLWVAYSPGPVVTANPSGKDSIDRPVIDSGIYYIHNASSRIVEDPSVLVKVKNDPNYNEIWPRPVVPYKRIYGIDKPSSNPPVGEFGPTRFRSVPEGSPVGYTGTSSMNNRESKHFEHDFFNDAHGKVRPTGAWRVQGADVGNVKNSDLHAVRIIVVVPNRYHTPLPSTAEERSANFLEDSRMKRQAKGYTNHTGEIWKILGEFPVGDPRGGGAGSKDPDGEPDTSWLARIPANTPHFVQGIDKRGMTIYTEQTWRHVSPGKTVADCGGCHAHTLEGISMENKKADASGYKPWDLVSVTPMIKSDSSGEPIVRNDARRLVGVEFQRDIFPLLSQKCASCHTGGGSGGLSMFDSGVSGMPAVMKAYRTLARANDHHFPR